MSGYTDIGGTAPSGEDMKAKLRTPTGIVAGVGLLMAMLGLVFQWTQTSEKWSNNAVSVALINKYGMYTLFMLGVATANIVSYLFGRPELMWMSTTVFVSILDPNVCAVNAIRAGRGSDSWFLIFAYSLVIAGTLLTFVTFPLKFEKVKGAVFHFIFILLIVVGTIVFWSSGTVCPDTGLYTFKDNNSDNIPATASMIIAVVYFVSTLTSYTPGLELSFMLGTVAITWYHPYGWRCEEDTCRAGLMILYITLIAMTVYHLVFSCARSAGRSIQEIMAKGLFQKFTFLVLCLVGALVGGIMIWADKRSGDTHAEPDEVWYNLGMIFVIVLNMFVDVYQHKGCAVAAFSVMYSVIIPNTVYINSTTSGGAAVVRTGYILLFLFSFLSFVALPFEWKSSVNVGHLDVEAKQAFNAALVLFLVVVYLWSDATPVYEVGLGFISLVIMLCLVKQFHYGLQWAYFATLLEIARLTPFTASGLWWAGSYSGTNKLLILVCLITLLMYISYHITKFGAIAFNSVRLFDMDASHEVTTTGSVPFLSQDTPGQSSTYGTGNV
eukprot:TRINITY_DN1562_c0_g1_i1.p1 TRINITY_DN1562_c0_g1~~TRINITY_DN1562_c0_g1_i1.p1  ORF type:complete len:552 (+),score=218.44 TRINITY_DN1562_c0_g1_i1:39-1694(+)